MRSEGAKASSLSVQWVPDVSRALVEAATALIAPTESDAGAVVRDARGAIVGADATAEAMLGMSWEELVTMSTADPPWLLVNEAGDQLREDQCPGMRALASGRVIVASCIGLLGGPSGETRWLEASAFPLFGPTLPGQQATPCGAITLLSDVSDSPRGRRAYESLVRSFRALAEGAADIVLRVDIDGYCTWVTPLVQELTGWAATALIGQELLEFVHPKDVDRVRRHAALARTKGSEQRYEVRTRQRDGSYRWWSAIMRADVDRHDAVRAIVITLRDADDAIREAERRAASERRFELLVENSADVIAHVRDGRYEWVSSSSESVLGLSPADLIGQDLARILHLEDRHLALQAMSELAAGRPSRFTVRSVAADKSSRWFELNTRPLAEPDSAGGGVVRLQDVTDEVNRRRLLEYRTRHDELTGLANRQVLIERMTAATTREPRPGQQVAVGFCDIDRFKLLNDAYGHEGGDLVLRTMADRITAMLRSTDTVARLGGDELILLLDGVHDTADAFDVLDKVRKDLRQPILIGAAEVRVTVSIGLAVAASGESPDDVLRRADLAVYRAKYLGRDRVEVAADRPSDEPTVGRHHAPEDLEP